MIKHLRKIGAEEGARLSLFSKNASLQKVMGGSGGTDLHYDAVLSLLPAAPPAWTSNLSSLVSTNHSDNNDPDIIPTFEFSSGSAFDSNSGFDLDSVSFRNRNTSPAAPTA
ncbi:hypothetical protein EVAR_44813_1 [Eumeta japonica]|uniref:Uncharacterized protein n=1 Tax=Eumeta variegata TaxID=151549 RepID=A0A4C1XBB8_EUMVA|nr:hypothetical protein EVAR_44813_1 [Eumeta japonica]